MKNIGINNMKAKLLEDERQKLHIQQKALDEGAQMSLTEIKMLQKESTKKVIDRVLFVFGLIMATILICVIVWPMFSVSMSFFATDEKDAYAQGLIKVEYRLELKIDTGIYEIKDIDKTDTVGEGVYKKVTGEVFLTPDELAALKTKISEHNEIVDSAGWSRLSAYCSVSEDLRAIASKDAPEHLQYSQTWRSSRIPFFAGYNTNDWGLKLLYGLSGIVFFCVLIAMVALYVILMSYGIRYFVAIVRSILSGTKNLVTDAGKNVMGAVLEEGADTSLETFKRTVETNKKRKEASKPVIIDAPVKAIKQPKRRILKKAVEPSILEESSDIATPTVLGVALDNLSDEQLDDLLNGTSAPETGTERESLFKD